MGPDDVNDAGRYERERSFHDDTFGSKGRAAVSKYYPADAPSKIAYEGALGSIPPGAKVLEYGCGPGSAAFGLATAGADVTGIDISGVAIEQAKARAIEHRLEICFREMNAEFLEFDDDSFDAVCGSGILHHLDLDRAYGEVARVLRPKGMAVFLEPLGHNPALRLYRRLTPKLRTPDEHPLLAADLVRAEEQFGRVDVTYHQLLWLASVPARRIGLGDRVAHAGDRADRWLFENVPAMRKHAWTAVIRLSQPRSAVD